MGWELRRTLRCVLLLGVVTLCVALVAQCEEERRGYRMTSIRELRDGTGIVAPLELIGEGTELYGPDIKQLQVIARYEGDSVHVHITDANSPRWEVPQSVIPRPSVKSLEASPPSSPPAEDGWHEVSIHWPPPMLLKYSVDPFGFSVTRRSDNEVLFNTLGDEFNSLVFKDQYLEISTRVPESAYLYGLGEVTRPDGLRLLPNRTFTLWATDIATYFTDIPLYSSYPFIMDMRESGNAHGVLLLNSNGMDIRYTENFFHEFYPNG